MNKHDEIQNKNKTMNSAHKVAERRRYGEEILFNTKNYLEAFVGAFGGALCRLFYIILLMKRLIDKEAPGRLKRDNISSLF